MINRQTFRREVFICGALLLVTFGLFFQVRQHEFINYDDQLYLTGNYIVQQGWTKEGLAWAFGNVTGNGTYWHPLAWVSHMLDVEWFGMDAGKHHLASLGFHCLNALLVFLLLRTATRAVWRSAIVAALFAWHPLQVDSVAWAAERKNLLSTMFALLALLTYVGYARNREAAGSGTKAICLYLGTGALFACGLMSKPSLVTLPCVMLLLDWWPLNRVVNKIEGRRRSLGTSMSVSSPLPSPPLGGGEGVVSRPSGSSSDQQRFEGASAAVFARAFCKHFAEKIPFFVLSVITGLITVKAHKKLDLVMSTDLLPFSSRLANSVVGYWSYVRKVFWPDDLAVYYPMPERWPLLLICAGTALVVLAGFASFMQWRKRPYLFSGWFWFFGTLLPFIGIIQVNDQAMADRFFYWPAVGLFVVLVWGAAEGLKGWLGANKLALTAITGFALVACLTVTGQQLQHWRNSETLFTHALKVTKGNNIAHINLGAALETRGELEAAREQYVAALAIKPNNSMAESNLGVILAKLGRLNEAMPHFEQALKINPDNPDAHSNLGLALSHLRKFDEATQAFEQALRLKPEHAQANQNFANLLLQQGKLDAALPHYQTALKFQPANSDLHNDVGFVLLKMERHTEAEAEFAAALRLVPDHARAHFNLGSLFLKTGQEERAREHLTAATQADPGFAEAHLQLGLLLRKAGDVTRANAHLNEVLRLRPDWHDKVEAAQKT